MTNKVIKFDCNYPKLCNQAHARLLFVWEIEESDFILNYPALKALFEYDTRRPDGTLKEFEKGEYLLLLLEGDKGILFTTIRKNTPSNNRLYKNNIGKYFDIEVKNAE